MSSAHSFILQKDFHYRLVEGIVKGVLLWCNERNSATVAVFIGLFLSSQLFLFLQDFSQRMLSKTHDIEKQLDSLICDTKATDSCLHSVFNDFLMLSNTQFIENVMYIITHFLLYYSFACCAITVTIQSTCLCTFGTKMLQFTWCNLYLVCPVTESVWWRGRRHYSQGWYFGEAAWAGINNSSFLLLTFDGMEYNTDQPV